MTTERPLIGWKAIAEHLGVTRKSAKRWVQEWYRDKGIPRTPGGKPMIYADEIRQMRVRQ